MAYYKCGKVYTTPNSNVVIDNVSGAIANFNTQLCLPLIGAKNEGSSGVGLYWVIKYTDGTQTTNTCQNSESTYTEHSVTSTAGKTISLIKFSYASSGNNVWHLTDIQLEENTSATDYEPYNGSTTSIIFPPYTENLPYFEGLLNGTYGFVYLGDREYTKFDVAQGTLFRTKYIPNMQSDLGSALAPSVLAIGYTPSSTSARTDKTISISAEGVNTDFINDDYSTVEDFTASMRGKYLIYKYQTPQTPTITPEQYETLWRAFAGVYYGGQVEQDRYGHRRFKVTWGCVNLGNYNYYSGSNSHFNITAKLSNAPSGLTSKCKCEKYLSNIGAYVGTVDLSCCINNGGYIYFYDTAFVGDATAFKNSMSGVKFIYELAEPFTVDLPDGTPIKSFPGVNNIYCDTGDTSLQFRKIG